jgi:hypothetical protein
MNTISKKTGYWSALLIMFSFLVFTICFTGIAVSSPMFRWTGLIDYLSFVKSHSQTLQNTARASMLLFGPLFVILISSFYDYAPESRKPAVRISLAFALAFAVLSSLHYFVQLSAVRMNILNGQTLGLENYVQANPYSVMTAADMAGWTLFFGLSSLFMFPVFGKEKVIKYAFLANGISCLLGGVGYLFRIDILTFLFINLGVGASVLTLSAVSMRLFRKMEL